MDDYPTELENYKKTTSGSISGGCLLFNLPPLLFVVIAAFFIVSFGKSSTIALKNKTLKVSNQAIPMTSIAPFFSPEVQHWSSNILIWAEEHDLDPNLIATVMQIESCGNPIAESYAGATGLFQVMPYHFEEGEYPFEPLTNAKRGLDYLRLAFETHHSIRLALAGYNGGIATSGKPENQWPDQTIRYVYWGENIYQEALAGFEVSPTLEEWLSAGGASLCEQAKELLALN